MASSAREVFSRVMLNPPTVQPFNSSNVQGHRRMK
jgi:hypothetical protein